MRVIPSAPVKRGEDASIAIALCVFTLLVFRGVLHNEFVNWDDLIHFVDHPRKGVSIARAFEPVWGQITPLAWLTIDFLTATLGRSAGVIHGASLMLHCVAVLLVFDVSKSLLRVFNPDAPETSMQWASAFAAFAFALHPLRVEAVAWAMNFGGVLSVTFALGCSAAWLRSRGLDRWLWISFACFVASLLAKSWTVMLPFALAVLEVVGRKQATSHVARRIAPFAAIAVADIALALSAQGSHHGKALWEWHPLHARVMQAAYGSVFYVQKTIAPVKLSPLYELKPEFEPFSATNVASLVLVTAGLAASAVMARRGRPAWFVALTSYLVLVFPALGFAQNGPQLVADRYAYFSTIPLCVLGSAALLRLPTAYAIAATLAVIVALAPLTGRQIRVWRTSESLWDHAIRIDPASSIARVHRADDLRRRGQNEQALAEAQEAVRLAATPATLAPRGRLFLESGDAAHARADFNAVIAMVPDHVPAIDGRARASVILGDLAAAEADWSKLVELDAENGAALNNRGSVRRIRGDLDRALHDFDAAIRLDPRLASAFANRAATHLARGDAQKALDDVDRALALAPENRFATAVREEALRRQSAP